MGKRLIVAADIESVYKSGQGGIVFDANTIITPLAADRAKELGIGFGNSRKQTSKKPEPALDEEYIRKVVRSVIIKISPAMFSPRLVKLVTEQVKQRIG